jgi:DivIVA domain-containing protein
MDLNELTPELFEKAEFTERRRGYDIDQVERFLEETGTAVAQLLVRHRQLEERAVHAETRLAAAEEQLAKRPEVIPARPAPSPEQEAEEVEKATSTLLMAKRTADATIAESEAEGARIVDTARREAQSELDSGRERLMEVVTALEGRRDSLAGVVEGYEARIAAYREQLSEVAGALVAMAEDPEAMAARKPVLVPDSAQGTARDDSRFFPEADEPEVDITEATQAHDTAKAAAEPDPDADEGPSGSPEPAGAASPAASGPIEAAARESGVVVDAEPVTGQTSDRFLRELDEAVNESESAEADSMSAFFDRGEGDEDRGRFGWRR